MGFEKLVLGGGIVSETTLNAAIELSGSEHPTIAVDTSPKVSLEQYTDAVSSITALFKACRQNSPTFLNIESTSSDKNEALIENLQAADILMVTGGSTLRAYQRWQAAGAHNVITERVSSGELVGFGASAGAMIWFQNGLSDSMQYEDSANENPWEYIDAPGAGIVPAWVTAHYSDIDEHGRERSKKFIDFLDQYHDHWRYAIGIDSDATVISMNGFLKVIEAGSRDSRPNHVHVFDQTDSSRPITLSDGDTFNLQ